MIADLARQDKAHGEGWLCSIHMAISLNSLARAVTEAIVLSKR